MEQKLITNYLKWQPHPWHGLEVGPQAPSIVTAFVEITPFDPIKYEVDKHSGFLKVDRPQYSSARPPSVYGFIPRTLSGAKVGTLMPGATSGDDDPLDICVVSSHLITQSKIILSARVIGGIPVLDANTADDKIIGVLVGDGVWGEVTDITQLPPAIIDQLAHYFSTYKQIRRSDNPIIIGKLYGHEHAEQVVSTSMADYSTRFL